MQVSGLNDPVQNVGQRFEEMEAELGALQELGDKPAGTIRITAAENAAEAILLPKEERRRQPKHST
jgi:hypothetical protein